MCHTRRVIPKKSVAMKDVAERLGVSVSTVSRVLSGKPGIAKSTRERVLAAVQESGYVVASRPADGTADKAGRVCVLVPRTDAWYYSAVIAGVEETLRQNGIGLSLYCLPSSDDRADFFARFPLADEVDGIIAVSFPLDDEALASLSRLPVPMVSVSVKYPGIPSVSIDDALSAVQAVNQLIRSGHRRIGLIRTNDPDGRYWESDVARADGYHAALAAADIAEEDDLMVTAPWGIDGGAEAMQRLLSLEAPPTAVFCFSDEVAIGALRTLRRTGVAVPEGMSVIAVDDHPMAELTGLTTIGQPARRLGTVAAEMIIALGHDESVEDLVLPTHLVARHTTAAPGGHHRAPAAQTAEPSGVLP